MQRSSHRSCEKPRQSSPVSRSEERQKLSRHTTTSRAGLRPFYARQIREDQVMKIVRNLRAACDRRSPILRARKLKPPKRAKHGQTVKHSSPRAGQSSKWRTRRVLIPWPAAGTTWPPDENKQVPAQQKTNAGIRHLVIAFRRLTGSRRTGELKRRGG